MPKRTTAALSPEPKPTVPATPRVLIPDPPPPTRPTPPGPSAAVAAAFEAGAVSPSRSPLAEALQNLLDTCPLDIATCSGVTPARLAKYLEARHIAVAVLATEK